jgi:hypothetical protein
MQLTYKNGLAAAAASKKCSGNPHTEASLLAVANTVYGYQHCWHSSR